MATANQPITEAIAAARREIEAVRAQIETVTRAPVPLEVARGRLDTWLDQIATYRPAFGPLFSPTFSGGFGDLVPNTDFPRGAFQGFLVTLLRELLEERAATWLAETAHTLKGQLGESLTDAERAQQLETLRNRLRTLERDEERWIRQAEGEGLVLDRRGDADPSIVLADVA